MRGDRMSKTIKVGGILVEVPDDSPLAGSPDADESPALTAEKPEEPEKLETLQYVYRPNDPFQANIDRVVVLRNIESSGKPWVRKAFVFFFLIFPMLIAEIAAVGALATQTEEDRWRHF